MSVTLDNFSCMASFKCVDAGRIDCPLVQLVPPFYNSVGK